MADEEKPNDPSSNRVLASLRQTVESACHSQDTVTVRSDTHDGLITVALLASGTAQFEFSGTKAQANWDRAKQAIREADAEVIGALQRHMGPATSVVFLAQLMRAICHHHKFSTQLMQALFRHISDQPNGPGTLPLDQALEMGAAFSRGEHHL